VAEYRDEEALNIYTDGSSFSGPRRGGVGVRFIVVDEGGHEVEHDFPLPGYEDATNNMMELQAPIEALRALLRGQAPVDANDFKKVVFWSDSLYVVETIYNARYVWAGRRWMSTDGNPIANVAQWKELVRLIDKLGRRVDFKWVKGHRSSANNKKVDKLAKASAQTRIGRRLGVAAVVRRKLSPNKTERGSVQMRGQAELVHVISSSLTPQRVNEYRYQIVAEQSDDFQKVDVAYAERGLVLRAGHFYEVRFNNQHKTPRILELLEEIDNPQTVVCEIALRPSGLQG
jgi:ribonuclease HI